LEDWAMLTDRQIRSLKTDRLQLDVFDGEIPGFGVRVTKIRCIEFFLSERVFHRVKTT
jgi:hypothetical protein